MPIDMTFVNIIVLGREAENNINFTSGEPSATLETCFQSSLVTIRP
jgi:hypothetical protein